MLLRLVEGVTGRGYWYYLLIGAFTLCLVSNSINCLAVLSLLKLRQQFFQFIICTYTEKKSPFVETSLSMISKLCKRNIICWCSHHRFSQRTQHILLSLMDMVQNARTSTDLDYVYDLTTTLLQYGANPNINISTTEPMICHSQSSVFLKKSSNQVSAQRFLNGCDL